MRPEQRPEVEVAGVVNQHRLAGSEQEAADQINRLRAGGRQQELFGCRPNALLREPAEQQSAQGR